MVVSHEASRSGAPILVLNICERIYKTYNVISVLLNGGDLVEDFVALSNMTLLTPKFSPINSALIARQALEHVHPDFAIVNSALSGSVLPVFSTASVPAVTLIHEFASTLHPKRLIEDIVRWSAHLVFSAPIVQQDAERQLPNWLPGETTHILPQGRCKTRGKDDADQIRRAFRPEGSSGAMRVVIGAGSVSIRKGSDLFIQCAQQIMKRRPGLDVRFVWIGHGYAPERDMAFSVYLSEQIRRSGLEGRMLFMGEVASLDSAYREADLFLLTSRLDPLPNVGIDAICEGLPIVCFEAGSGIADLLASEGLSQFCVVPYLDTAAMADLAIRILEDPNHEATVKSRLLDMGGRSFDMDKYVSQIERLLAQATADMAAEEQEVRAIVDSGTFEAAGFARDGRRGAVRKTRCALSLGKFGLACGNRASLRPLSRWPRREGHSSTLIRLGRGGSTS